MSRSFWAAEHWCQEESGKVRHSFEAVVLVCAVLMLPAVLIQDSSLHNPWGKVADGLGTFVWVVFALELAFTLEDEFDLLPITEEDARAITTVALVVDHVSSELAQRAAGEDR